MTHSHTLKREVSKRYKVVKLPPWMTEVSVGDICIQTGETKVLSEKEGFGKEWVGRYIKQFHSTCLVNRPDLDRENYWVEFLPDNCVELLPKKGGNSSQD